MAVLDKPTLHTKIATDLPDNGGGAITPALLRGVLDDVVDSYEDYFPSYSTAARNALIGVTTGTIIYNVDTDCLELYAASSWNRISNRDYFPLDCSTNPDYPEGIPNDMFYVSVAGKIGGGSGKTVNVGDLIWCIATNGGGNEATVGNDWVITYSARPISEYGDVQKVTVTLSQAEIAALNATPKIAVAAQGANTMIMVLRAVMRYTYGTAAYNAQDVNIKFTTGVTAIGFLGDLSTPNSFISSSVCEFGNEDGWRINENLVLGATGAMGGTGDETATVQIWYKVINV